MDGPDSHISVFICYLYNPSQVYNNSHAIADVMYNTEVMEK